MNILKNFTPNHIAIIMDGNGRWAKNRGLSRTKGHEKGAETLEKIINYSLEKGIRVLTLYVFSTENWKRPKVEVNKIFSLFEKYLKDKKEIFYEKGIRVVVSGRRDNIKKSLIKTINEVEKYLENKNNLILNLAFNYGGRTEILDSIKSVLDKNLEITEENITKNLYNSFLQFPELVIRTGNETRISNFLIWQIAYSELYFSEKMWPDFNEEDLEKIIIEFSKRERRFGGIKLVK